eukprot:5200199-Amphidinium_carterae.1
MQPSGSGLLLSVQGRCIQKCCFQLVHGLGNEATKNTIYKSKFDDLQVVGLTAIETAGRSAESPRQVVEQADAEVAMLTTQ